MFRINCLYSFLRPTNFIHVLHVIAGDLNAVQSAVKKGADIKSLDDECQTAQDVASENGKLEMQINWKIVRN